MKKILTFFAAALAIAGCKKYEFNTEFSMPKDLQSPSAEIALDVTSSKTVTLTWTGSAAADGGLVLYNVVFDKEGGDFSNPLDVVPSDQGALPELTLTHSQLNILARKAGIKAGERGGLIWTVTGARGGVKKTTDLKGSIKVLRGEGIDNIPEKLFIGGSAAQEKGQEFRCESEGVFVITTLLANGNVKFTSEIGGGFGFFIDENGKLKEGDGESAIEAPETGLGRITVNFNTLQVSCDMIGQQVRCIWGANYNDIAVLEYVGNGEFVGDGDCVFLGPGREGTPDWCSWVEERYYFIAMVNGEETCWGHSFLDNPGGAWTPDGSDKFWEVAEHGWEQWNWLWKMDHAFDMKHVTYTISTNKDNRWVHSYVGGDIQYDQPTETPEALYLSGSVAEADDQPMRKEDSKFVIYNKFSAAGEISFVDGNGKKYFADADGKLFIGKPKTAVEASEGVTRVIVDFGNNTVTFDKIGDKVWVENAWDHLVMAELSYQGLGRWAGDGKILFAASGDERYSMRTTVNGVNMRWGSNLGNDGKLPETPEDWYVYESEWEGHQWDNLYKFNKDDQDKDATFVVLGNDPVHMTHSVTLKSGDPVPPTTAPSELYLGGTGAETEGQAFRKVKDGVFSIITRLSEGDLFFTGDGKNYFVDAEQGLLEGQGKGTAVASAADHVSRITVNFTTLEVTVEAVNEYAHLKFGADYRDLAHLKYCGNGNFKAEDAQIVFIDPNKPETNPPSWLSWVEERYYFIIEIDGTEKCWGSINEYTGNPNMDLKPNGNEHFYDIDEYTWSQWDHLWKFDNSINGATIDVEILTNDNGYWKHVITTK